MPNLVPGGAVFAGVTILVCRKCIWTVGIAARVAETVGAKQRDFLRQPGIERRDELILIVEARRFHLIDWSFARVREKAAARERGVDVARSEFMQAMGVDVVHGEGRLGGKLALDANRRLHQLR